MGLHDTDRSIAVDPAERDDPVEGYVPPRVERLGSLAELTLGGKGDPDDGFGGAGDEGSV